MPNSCKHPGIAAPNQFSPLPLFSDGKRITEHGKRAIPSRSSYNLPSKPPTYD